MATVYELYSYLNKIISPDLSCEWDNDGLMVCPDKFSDVKRVLLALDITSEVVEYAASEGFDVIISHHPLIFKPLKNVSGDDAASSKVISLIKNSVTAMSFHTRLDALDGGVNDMLAELLGVEDVEVLPGDPDMIGRIGNLEIPADPEEFSLYVKDQLGAENVNLVNAQLEVSRVALCGGDGKELLKAAYKAGADTYITGTLSYNNMIDAAQFPMNVIEAGHFYTENHVLNLLADLVEEFDELIEVEIYNSNIIKTI
ncbi:MAG: Nif3-like dinuclear metal center hexameric protein [Ruminococcaceae bacterium]|nr:Nif3-like dinuclear metal center hexameric protein [Oscillospiraceae bacterium]